MKLTKVDAEHKILFDHRGYLYDLFNTKYGTSAEFIIEKKKNQQEDALVYDWIGTEWVLTQCWEAKITDLFASVIGSNTLKSEIQRNSKKHPKDVQHFGIFVKPSANKLSYSKHTEASVIMIANSVMQNFPWCRYSFKHSSDVAIEKMAEWIKVPPVPLDCGIPVLNIEGSKNVISGMSALMNGMTTELATFCVMKIKEWKKSNLVSLRDLTDIPYPSWEEWFKGHANRNQKVLAKKWFILVNGVDFFNNIYRRN